MGDVDCTGGKLILRETKNRSDHKLLLSRQALEIAERYCTGRKPDEPFFAIVDARKTLAWINARAGTSVQGHGLRATFASIAEELVSGGALKRMLNHATGGDVTLGHYVGKSEAQLRAAWQTVADFIDAAAQQDADRAPVASKPDPAGSQNRGASTVPVQVDAALMPSVVKRRGRNSRRSDAG